MIPVNILMFDINPEPGFDLGRAPGSSLRGALYAALRTMYDNNQPVSRDDYDNNPIGWLLRLEDEESSGGKDVPRPIAIRPTLATAPNTFGLALYGKAREAIPLIVSAIPTMGRIGVGNRRRTFELKGVRSLDPLTGRSQSLISGSSKSSSQLPDVPDSKAYQKLAQMMKSDTLIVHFQTPARIIQKGKLCHQPIFRPWFQRLLERMRLISEVYLEEPLWIPFRDLLHDADQVQVVENETRWHESWSGSRRDGRTKPLGGFVGMARYEGPLQELLPYILLGQSLQVGKNTIKGCGWYDVVFQWK